MSDSKVETVGKKKKRGGRKPGQTNKSTREVKDFVDAVFARIPGGPEAVALRLLKAKSNSAAMMLKMLLEFRYGKAPQPVTGPDGAKAHTVNVNLRRIGA